MPLPAQNLNEGDQEPPFDLLSPADGRTLAMSITLLAFLGGLVLIAAVFATAGGHRELGSPLAGLACSVWMISAGSLIGVRIGLGNDPLYIRLGAVGFPCAVLMLFPSIAQGVAAIAVYFMAVALPLFILRFFGFEFKVRDADYLVECSQPLEFQFSIKQLLAWTVVASVVAMFVRFSGVIQPTNVSWPETIQAGVFDATFSASGLASVCATLMPNTKRLAAAAVLSASVFAALLGCGATMAVCSATVRPARGYRLEDFAFAGGGLACHALLISVVLLAFRGLGYRLWRRGVCS
jgi:hypothetical protein